MSLKGKTLSITGASRRIGLAVALRAARDGPNIAIAAKTKTLHPKLEGTIHLRAKAIEGAGGQALIDDTFLAAEGVTDFDAYCVDPSQPLSPDFFMPDPSWPPPGVSLSAKA
jgi:NAD(P)-dependent dehydrogenase (short-subunit alcohol dehydrogenase family)